MLFLAEKQVAGLGRGQSAPTPTIFQRRNLEARYIICTVLHGYSFLRAWAIG